MLAEFFYGSDIGIAIVDKQLRYRMVNGYLAASHRTPVESHFGKHLREILGSLAAQVEPAIEQVLGSALSLMPREISGPLPTRPEKTRWMGSYFPVFDATGSVKHVGAVILEVSKSIQLQAPQDLVSPNAVLRSWKDIARYVGACVKTVQRWEQAYEFPIRRVSPTKGSMVFAFQNEVEDWLRGRSHAEKHPRSAARRG